MIPLALVDTNVVVSCVLAGVATSPTRSILDAMLTGAVRFVLSEALLTEYRRVLLRPSVRERHQLTEVDVDAILEELVLNADLREPPVGEAPRPVVPGDEHVLALLAASPEAVLVTGDRHLREAVVLWREVLAPAEFEAALS